MDLRYRLSSSVESKLTEWKIRGELARLNDRCLADIGLERVGIGQFARTAAQPVAPAHTDAPAFRADPQPVPTARLERRRDLPAFTSREIALFVRRGEQLRNEEVGRHLRAMGQGIARLGAELAQPVALLLKATGLPQRAALAWMWHREFHKVRAELESYSERELTADLQLNRSGIPGIAADAADERVAAFVQARPDYRSAWGWGRHSGGVASRA